MTAITSIWRNSEGNRYGVHFAVCGNDEVLADWCDLGEDPTGSGWGEAIRAAFRAAVGVIEGEHMDYEQNQAFRDWRGGCLSGRGPVVPIYWVSEDGDEGDWRRVSKVPEQVARIADEIADRAAEAMRTEAADFIAEAD